MTYVAFGLLVIVAFLMGYVEGKWGEEKKQKKWIEKAKSAGGTVQFIEPVQFKDKYKNAETIDDLLK